MKVLSINIPKNEINYGLESIKMSKIGRIVLIAGKNGSGKSRLLKTIKEVLGQKPTLGSIELIKAKIEQSTKDIEIQFERNVRFQTATIQNPNSPSIGEWGGEMRTSQKVMSELEKNRDEYFQILRWNLIETDSIANKYEIIEFLPKSLILTNNKSLTQIDAKTKAISVQRIGIEKLAESVLPYLQMIQDKRFNATHPDLKFSTSERDLNISNYERLQRLLDLFLNTKLDRNIEGDAILFGFPLGQSNLSDGQKVLLQLCVAIHAQGALLKDLIIFMDEPENHLHPSVVIDIIQKIEENIPNGQLWIATHSIPLLSHFDPKYLWFMENNTIKYSGRTPENVLKTLLGDDDRIAKVHNFMNLPSIYALNRFAHECLFDPEVLMTDSKDPQIRQISKFLRELSNKVGKLKILDFGAGKGRLLANVIEALGDDKTTFTSRYDYIAYDIFDSDKKDCIANIESIYENIDKRYYNNQDRLFADHDKDSFHVVVMCNVLHEIPIEDWKSNFGENGFVVQCLADNGYLLLVEDNEMPVGEKAHQKGFLVIDTPEIKDLFCLKSDDNDFVYNDERGDGRLKAHLIPKRGLKMMTHETLKRAVQSLSDKASRNIIEIRSKGQSFKNGMKHGFWVQLFANAQLILKELK